MLGHFIRIWLAGACLRRVMPVLLIIVLIIVLVILAT